MGVSLRAIRALLGHATCCRYLAYEIRSHYQKCYIAEYN